jgi:lycopene cyclase domain-containing protein
MMMKEYTILSVVSFLLTVLIGRKSPSRIFQRSEFYIFLLIILFFKVLVNGYLTSRLIVIYNPRYFLNVRIGSIPVEDFLFGFSMITLTIVLWEYFRRIFSSRTG